jgi:pilus assembly protein CpaB
MRKRVLTILLIALAVAACGSYIVYRMIQGRLTTDPTMELSRVLIASRDLQIGTLLRDEDISTGKWVGTPLKGMLRDKKVAIGRGVVSGIYKGEPLLEDRLAQPGAGGGLAAIIPAGMRACAVKVNEVVGVAGFVLPGMRVDVLVAGTPPNAGPVTGPKVRTLLQNIEVLSAGENLQKDVEGKPVQVQVVNLLVTPAQAEVLSLASNETRIQLVLRNPLDTRTETTPGTAMASLFADQNKPVQPVPPVRPRAAMPKPAPAPQAVTPAPPPEPQVVLVEVLNGSKRTETRFVPSRETGQ